MNHMLSQLGVWWSLEISSVCCICFDTKCCSLLISSWDERSFPIYPLTPKSDWQVTSPYHTHELLSKKVTRINNQILGVKELSDSLLVWTYFCVIPVASSCFYLHNLFYKDQVQDLINIMFTYIQEIKVTIALWQRADARNVSFNTKLQCYTQHWRSTTISFSSR